MHMDRLPRTSWVQCTVHGGQNTREMTDQMDQLLVRANVVCRVQVKCGEMRLEEQDTAGAITTCATRASTLPYRSRAPIARMRNRAMDPALVGSRRRRESLKADRSCWRGGRMRRYDVSSTALFADAALA